MAIYTTRLVGRRAQLNVNDTLYGSNYLLYVHHLLFQELPYLARTLSRRSSLGITGARGEILIPWMAARLKAQFDEGAYYVVCNRCEKQPIPKVKTCLSTIGMSAEREVPAQCEVGD